MSDPSKDVLGDYEEKPDIWASAVRYQVYYCFLSTKRFLDEININGHGLNALNVYQRRVDVRTLTTIVFFNAGA